MIVVIDKVWFRTYLLLIFVIYDTLLFVHQIYQYIKQWSTLPTSILRFHIHVKAGLYWLNILIWYGYMHCIYHIIMTVQSRKTATTNQINVKKRYLYIYSTRNFRLICPILQASSPMVSEKMFQQVVIVTVL